MSAIIDSVKEFFWPTIPQYQSPSHPLPQVDGEKDSSAMAALLTMTAGMAGENQPKTYLDYQETYGEEIWVYACVSKKAKSAASVPLRCYRGEGEQRREMPLPKALAQPNPRTSLKRLIQATVTFQELTGDAPWELVGKGRPVEIYSLRPDRFRVVPGNKDIEGYLYRAGGKEVRYDVDEVLHHKYTHPFNDWYGCSPLEAAALTVDQQTNARTWNKTFFYNSARPDGFYETDQKIDKKVANELMARLRQAHKGVDKAHREAILSHGLKWKQAAISPKDAEFLNLMKLGREEICSVFGVPPAVVGIFEYANYANADMQKMVFWQDTMVPLLDDLAGTINLELMPRFGDGLYVEFDTSGVEALKENQKELWEVRKMRVELGAATINEVRNEDGMDDVEWGDEDPRKRPAVPAIQLADMPQDGPPDDMPPKHAKKDCGCSEHKTKLDKSAFLVKQTELIDGQIAGLKSTAVEFFTAQQQRALKRLAEISGKGIKLSIDLTGYDLLNIADEVDEMYGAFYREILKAITEGAINGDRVVGIESPVWGLESLELVEAADKACTKLAKDVTDTTVSAIKDELRAGFEEGDGYSNLKTRIEGVFEQAKGYRAEMIARTEGSASVHRGELESYRAAGIEKKEWLFGAGLCTSGVCPELDGKIVEINSPYGWESDDGKLSVEAEHPPAHPNCTCTVVPVID